MWVSLKGVNMTVARRLSGHKVNIPLGFIVYVYFAEFFSEVAVPCTYYTSIFTDATESGKYVRETVRLHNPQVWRTISEQLYQLGYRFPEMNQAVSGDFPTALLDVYEASLTQ